MMMVTSALEQDVELVWLVLERAHVKSDRTPKSKF
jgi:hypothetical protein